MLEKTKNKLIHGPELLLLIAEAFPLQIISQEIFENTKVSWEEYDCVQVFESAVLGKSWDMLDSAFIEAHASAIIYLEQQAFVSIFPAYLSYLVRNEVYSEVPFMVASKLTRTHDELERRMFKRMVNTLSHAQKRVIKQALVFLSKNEIEEVMQLALANYWKEMTVEST